MNGKALADAIRRFADAFEQAMAEPVVAPAPAVEGSACAWVAIRKCGLPLRTVRLAVRQREIGAARVGRDLFVDMRDVRAFVERRRVDGADDDCEGDEVTRAIARKNLRLVGGRGR